MHIEVNKVSDSINVLLSGRLDSQSYLELESKMDEIFKESISSIVFDFSSLQYISSAGLRVILLFVKQTKTKNIDFKIINASEEIIDVFKLTGFIDIVSIDYKRW